MPNAEAIVAQLRELADRYPEETSYAIGRVLLEILAESKKICPVKTGYLRGSGYVADPIIAYGQILASIGYSAEYAYWVHECVENYHHPPTKAKFLEEPLQMYGQNIPKAIHSEVMKLLGVG